jgi:uncharacterized protein (TIGR02145 family)
MKKMIILLLFLTIAGIAGVSAQVTIGTINDPDEWSLLDLKENASGTSAKALHLPRLTSSERDALTASEQALTKGLVIYNTTTDCLEYWNQKEWVSLCMGQANITFTNPIGSDAGDISLTPFSATGEKRGPYIPRDNMVCTAEPAYTFRVISGAEYTTVNVEDLATGRFTISMRANETALERTAIVQIFNDCSGEYREFIFRQEGDDTGCETTIPDIKNVNGLELCTGGAVYLYLDGYPATGTYIWTLGDIEKGRGSSFVATAPGTYKVYGGKIGCATYQTVDVTAGTDAAPAPVSLIAQNNGFVCDAGDKTRLFASAASGGTIVWYKDSIKTGETGQEINAGAGKWFAVVEDGGCSSVPSNTVTVSLDPNAGTPIPTPAFTINGAPATGTMNLCSGGTLVLDVTNVQDGATYTWLMDNTEKGSGTHFDMSLAGITSGFVLQCRATGEGCSSAGTARVSISGSAPGVPSITANTPGNALCDGTATLTAHSSGAADSYIWYYSGSRSGTYSVISGKVSQMLDITETGYYRVAVKKGNCVSVLSNAIDLSLSSAAASVTISGDAGDINKIHAGNTRTYTAVMDHPQGASYSWAVEPGATGATPLSGSGSSISLRFANAGTATLTLTAANACGAALVANNSYQVTVDAACVAPSVASYSPAVKSVTVFEGSIGGNLSITASGSPTLSYEWHQLPGDAVVGTNSASFPIPAGLTQGTYRYYCKLTSTCDNNTVTSDPFTVTVNPNPGTYPAGAGSFAGRTCFDVAETNDGGECGDLTTRQAETLTANGARADFSNTLTRNQTYTFTTSGAVSNVQFYYIEDGAHTGQIVESISGGNSNNDIAPGTQIPCNIVYKNDLNGKAAGKSNADALTVDIYAVYNDNPGGGGTDKSVKLTALIKDCACCGAFTTTGNWLNFMCYNLGAADPNLTTPAQQMAATPASVYGSYFQWGQNKAWPTTGDVSGWSSSGGNASDAAWGDGGSKNTANDPCPAGWRVPSQAQWGSIFRVRTESGAYNTATVNTWTWQGSTTTHGAKVGNFLFLPAAGFRLNTDGSLHNQSSSGNYQGTTPLGSYAYNLSFDSSNVYPASRNDRSYGFSVRCVVE